jgi:hypothetical protein
VGPLLMSSIDEKREKKVKETSNINNCWGESNVKNCWGERASHKELLGEEKCGKSRKKAVKNRSKKSIKQSSFDITCNNMIGRIYKSHVVCDYIEGGVIVLGIENWVIVTII